MLKKKHPFKLKCSYKYNYNIGIYKNVFSIGNLIDPLFVYINMILSNLDQVLMDLFLGFSFKRLHTIEILFIFIYSQIFLFITNVGYYETLDTHPIIIPLNKVPPSFFSHQDFLHRIQGGPIISFCSTFEHISYVKHHLSRGSTTSFCLSFTHNVKLEPDSNTNYWKTSWIPSNFYPH